MFAVVVPGRRSDFPRIDDGSAVDVDGTIHVYIDSAMPPVPVPPTVAPECPHRKTNPEPDNPGGDHHIGRVPIHDVGRIERPPPWSVYHPWVVDGHVDHLRTVRLDNDDIAIF